VVEFHSVDNAGNVEQNEFSKFQIEAPTSTSLASSVNPSSYRQSVTFTATVTATFGGVQWHSAVQGWKYGHRHGSA